MALENGGKKLLITGQMLDTSNTCIHIRIHVNIRSHKHIQIQMHTQIHVHLTNGKLTECLCAVIET